MDRQRLSQDRQASMVDQEAPSEVLRTSDRWKESTVTKSQDRVEARRAIQERAIARRREREQREERIARLALAVNVALRSGRHALEEAEHDAGIALTQMIATEGLTVTEAIEWVGDAKLSARAVARLRGLSRDSSKPSLPGGLQGETC
jgi:hypothetical protein